MTESEKLKASSGVDIFPQSAAGPLVFITHDGRDAESAEAFSKLLKSVSAGTEFPRMLEHMLMRTLETKKKHTRQRKTQKTQQEQEANE